MKHLAIIFFLLISLSSVNAQTRAEIDSARAKLKLDDDKELASFSRVGILAAQATISPGIMIKPVLSNIFIHGSLEYYTEDRVSLRGDGYYFINTIEDYKPFKLNHSLFAGICYHLTKQSQYDPYFAIEPGVSMSQKTAQVILPVAYDPLAYYGESNITYNPLLSGVIGLNYYSKKLFYLLVSFRYINGDLLSNTPPQNLDEIRFSFGLGWYLKIKKKKKFVEVQPDLR